LQDLKNVDAPRVEADIWFPSGEVSIQDHVPDAAARGGGLVLVCPWMRGLAAASGPWLAALSIHDCNSYLESAPPVAPSADCWFGVFALDRLRSAESLFGLLRTWGIRNIINFPSVSFFDGTMAQTLTGLGYSIESEARFLAQAREARFGIALCSNRPPSPAMVESLDLAIWLRHAGPEQPFVVNRRQPSRPGARLQTR
jgi:predicted TIM-barrel enzyme